VQRQTWVWIAFALIAAPRGASAFESDEHKWFTDSALCAVAGQLPHEAIAEDVIAGFRSIDGSNKPGEGCGSLGEITVYADFATAPRRVSKRGEQGQGRVEWREVRKGNESFVVGLEEVIRESPLRL